MDKIRKHFIFYGSVQGVGFRYRAYHTALRLGITGWVKNLSDGSVEMEAQGSERDIDELILSIERGSYIRIENLEIKDMPVADDRSFDVR